MIKKICAKIYYNYYKYKIRKSRHYKIVKSSYYQNQKDKLGLHDSSIFSEDDFKPKYQVTCEYSKSNVDLSIIIPVYNTEKFLIECIESIVNQHTHYIFELILVNNASQDNSIEIISDYQKRYPDLISVVTVDVNKGPGAGKNAGLNYAAGKYISFVDSDDIMEDDFVETFIEQAYLTDSDVVKGGYYQFDYKGRIRYKKVFDSKIISETEKLNDLVPNIDCFVWGSVIRKSLFDVVRFPTGYPKIIDDRMMQLLIYSRIKKIQFVEKIGYRYRLNLDGTTLSKKSYGLFGNQIVFYFDAVSKYEELGFERNFLFSRILLNEFGFFVKFAVCKLNKNIRKEIFCELCNYVSHKVEYFDEFNYIEKQYYDAFINYNYKKWLYLYNYRRAIVYLEKNK